MFIFASILLVAAIAIAIIGRFVNKARTADSDDPIVAFPIVAGCVGVISALCFLFSCLTFVSAGSVGVPVIFGSVQESYLPEGMHTINPFASVKEMSVRSQEYTMVSNAAEGAKQGDDSIFAQSSDGVVLQMNVTIIYKLVDADAPWVYRYLGPDYAESIVRSAARSAVPDATSKFTFEEAYSSKRELVGDKVKERMNQEIQKILRQYPGFKGTGVSAQTVFIREIHPSADLLKSIEFKMTKNQEQEAMDFVIAKEEKEAKRKKIEAGGIKDFQEIVTQGITPSLLEWKGIEATEKLAYSPNAKIVVIGNGKGNLPVILSSQQ